MNLVAEFLIRNWKALGFGSSEEASSLTYSLIMPRCRGRLVYLIFRPRVSQPFLVAKLQRHPATNGREVQALRQLLSTPAVLDGSVPRVLAVEEIAGRELILEKAVCGGRFTQSYVSKNREAAIRLVLAWLTAFHASSAISPDRDPEWFKRLLETPLDDFKTLVSLQCPQDADLAWCCDRLTSLRGLTLPLVFEHGDFGLPNMLLSSNHRIGVIDWELSEPSGLPLTDVFFFLNSVASVASASADAEALLSGFREAFFGPDAWARPYVREYVETLGIPTEAVRPVFLVCWVRYLSRFFTLLSSERSAAPSSTRLEWFNRNRYQNLWRYTVHHYSELNLV